MSREARFRVILAVTFIVGLTALILMPSAVDWSRSFSQIHDKPYGASLVYELLQKDYANATDAPRTVNTMDVPLADFSRFGIETQGQTWLVINATYEPDQVEISRLLAEVDRGTNVFIAAHLGRQLADTLGVSVRGYQNQSIVYQYMTPPDTETIVNVEFPFLAECAVDGPTVTLDLFTSYYYDLSKTEGVSVLASVNNQPIMVRMRLGEGSITLLSAPLLLTNYHIWNEDLEPTTAAVMAHITGEIILWDEHYKVGRPMYSTPLQLLLDNDNLRPAYFVALLGVILFIAFKVKREQRAVPVHLPPQNTSKAYIRRISSLLYDHDKKRVILDKRIRYLAHQLQLPDADVPQLEVERTSEKYNLPDGLLGEVLGSHGKHGRSDVEIFKLNKQIETIYSHIR